MLVFFKERLVFLSVPKTGSTAYLEALSRRADMIVSNPPGLKHAPVYRYNRFLRPMFKSVCGVDMDLMAVVREPIDWLGSWYRYRQRPAVRDKDKSTAGLTFDAFVSAYCEEEPPGYANVGSQEKFLRAQPGGAAVRYLFRYDDPAGLRRFLETRLGTLPQFRTLNVSPKGSLSLSPETEARLRLRHASSFALYESIGTQD